jgi:hypothetical protein
VEKTKQTRIVQFKDYVAGWLDSTVCDFVETLPAAGAAFALITCLDSDPNPAALFTHNTDLQKKLPGARTLGKGLLLPSKRLQDAEVRDHLFFGFDEIWFFPNGNITPKAASASIVGPKRIDRTKITRLGPWMENTGCTLALGDGSGLNIIVKARGLVKSLIASSLFQPDRVLAANGYVVDDTGRP